MKKNKRPTPQSKKDVRSAIFCGIGALFCLFSFKTMWMFFLLLVACVVLRIVLYRRHKVSEAKIEELMDKLENDYDDDDDEELTASIPRNVKMSKKDLKKTEAERKEAYRNFISDLEEELGDFDEDSKEEDDDEEM